MKARRQPGVNVIKLFYFDNDIGRNRRLSNKYFFFKLIYSGRYFVYLTIFVSLAKKLAMDKHVSLLQGILKG